MDFFGVMGPLIGMAKGQDALFFQFVHFIQTDLHLFIDVFVRQCFLLYVRLVLLFVGHENPPDSLRNYFASLAAAFLAAPGRLTATIL